MNFPSKDYSLYTLHFADDQIAITHDKKDLECMTRNLIEENKEWGLQVNMEKTKFMCVGEPKKNLEIEGNRKIEGCEEYILRYENKQ